MMHTHAIHNTLCCWKTKGKYPQSLCVFQKPLCFREPLSLHHLLPASLSQDSECWALVAESCPSLCDRVDRSPPGSSVRGILQARIREWVAMPSSRGSSRPRDRTRVSHTAGGLFTLWVTREAHVVWACYTSKMHFWASSLRDCMRGGKKKINESYFSRRAPPFPIIASCFSPSISTCLENPSYVPTFFSVPPSYPRRDRPRLLCTLCLSVWFSVCYFILVQEAQGSVAFQRIRRVPRTQNWPHCSFVIFFFYSAAQGCDWR